MKFEIKNRLTGSIQFIAEIECDEDAGTNLKIGLAVKWAFKTGADLRGADLRGAYLGGAYLGGADLRGADLRGADLRGADLRGAYLGGAYLGGAYLRGADLRGHKLAEGESFAVLGMPNGWSAFTYLTDGGEQRVKIGCQDKTIAEGREYWAGKEKRREVYAALAYAEAIGLARGWIKKAAP